MVRLKGLQQSGSDRRLPVQAICALSDFISLGFIGRVRVTVLAPKLFVAQLRPIEQRRKPEMIGLSSPGPKVL